MGIEFLGVERSRYQNVLKDRAEEMQEYLADANVMFVSADFLKKSSLSVDYSSLILEYEESDLVSIASYINNYGVKCLVKKGDETDFSNIIEKLIKNSKAQISNPNLGFLFYRLSHDLRSPLVSIEGLIELLKVEGDVNARSVFCDLILKSVKRLDLSLSKVLDMANFEREESLELSRVDLGESIERVLSSLKFMDGFSDIKITVEKKIESYLLADQVLVESILQNLMQNAVKYMDFNQGMPRIIVKYGVFANKVSLEVRDNGLGVAKTARKNLFDIFYRGQSDIPGSGLGLYIVRKAAVRMEGSVEVVEGLGDKGLGFEVNFKNYN